MHFPNEQTLKDVYTMYMQGTLVYPCTACICTHTARRHTDLVCNIQTPIIHLFICPLNDKNGFDLNRKEEENVGINYCTALQSTLIDWHWAEGEIIWKSIFSAYHSNPEQKLQYTTTTKEEQEEQDNTLSLIGYGRVPLSKVCIMTTFQRIE